MMNTTTTTIMLRRVCLDMMMMIFFFFFFMNRKSGLRSILWNKTNPPMGLPQASKPFMKAMLLWPYVVVPKLYKPPLLPMLADPYGFP